jgi:hypothetical protein
MRADLDPWAGIDTDPSTSESTADWPAVGIGSEDDGLESQGWGDSCGDPVTGAPCIVDWHACADQDDDRLRPGDENTPEFREAVRDFRNKVRPVEPCEPPCLLEQSARHMLKALRRVDLPRKKIKFNLTPEEAADHPRWVKLDCDREQRLVEQAWRLLVANRDLIRFVICRFQTDQSGSEAEEARLHRRLNAVLTRWLSSNGPSLRVIGEDDERRNEESGLDRPHAVTPRVTTESIGSPDTFNGVDPATRMPVRFRLDRFGAFNFPVNLLAEAEVDDDPVTQLEAILLGAELLLHELFHVMGFPDWSTQADDLNSDRHSREDAGSLLHMMSTSFVYLFLQRVPAIADPFRVNGRCFGAYTRPLWATWVGAGNSFECGLASSENYALVERWAMCGDMAIDFQVPEGFVPVEEW